jgi:hypothetical protein
MSIYVSRIHSVLSRIFGSAFGSNKMGSVTQENAEPLDIIIAGAGIAGLSAAITLRRAGHNVTVWSLYFFPLITDLQPRYTNAPTVIMNSAQQSCFVPMPAARPPNGGWIPLPVGLCLQRNR